MSDDGVFRTTTIGVVSGEALAPGSVVPYTVRTPASAYACYAVAALMVLCAIADLVAAIADRSWVLAIYVFTFSVLAFTFRILGKWFAEADAWEKRITERGRR